MKNLFQFFLSIFILTPVVIFSKFNTVFLSVISIYVLIHLIINKNTKLIKYFLFSSFLLFLYL